MDTKQAEETTNKLRVIFRDGANALGAVHAALDTPRRLKELEVEVRHLRDGCYRLAKCLIATWALAVGVAVESYFIFHGGW